MTQPEGLQFNSRGHRPRIDVNLILSTLKGSNSATTRGTEIDIRPFQGLIEFTGCDSVAVPPAIESHPYSMQKITSADD